MLTDEGGQLKFEIPPEEQWGEEEETAAEPAQPSYYTAEQVVAIVLRQLRSSAESALGRSVSGAVLAYPSHFSSIQRAGLCKAAQLAGLVVGLSLLVEGLSMFCCMNCIHEVFNRHKWEFFKS